MAFQFQGIARHPSPGAFINYTLEILSHFWRACSGDHGRTTTKGFGVLLGLGTTFRQQARSFKEREYEDYAAFQRLFCSDYSRPW